VLFCLSDSEQPYSGTRLSTLTEALVLICSKPYTALGTFSQNFDWEANPKGNSGLVHCYTYKTTTIQRTLSFHISAPGSSAPYVPRNSATVDVFVSPVSQFSSVTST